MAIEAGAQRPVQYVAHGIKCSIFPQEVNMGSFRHHHNIVRQLCRRLRSPEGRFGRVVPHDGSGTARLPEADARRAPGRARSPSPAMTTARVSRGCLPVIFPLGLGDHGRYRCPDILYVVSSAKRFLLFVCLVQLIPHCSALFRIGCRPVSTAQGGNSYADEMVSANTTIQNVIPDEYRGRMMALYSMTVVGLGPLGSLAARHHTTSAPRPYWHWEACWHGRLPLPSHGV